MNDISKMKDVVFVLSWEHSEYIDKIYASYHNGAPTAEDALPLYERIANVFMGTSYANLAEYSLAEGIEKFIYEGASANFIIETAHHSLKEIVRMYINDYSEDMHYRFDELEDGEWTETPTSMTEPDGETTKTTFEEVAMGIIMFKADDMNKENTIEIECMTKSIEMALEENKEPTVKGVDKPALLELNKDELQWLLFSLEAKVNICKDAEDVSFDKVKDYLEDACRNKKISCDISERFGEYELSIHGAHELTLKIKNLMEEAVKA